jgi:pyruvate/2-oxoglutarate dehydrogenase complex dihydrolipoamide acyltransferase (E2) component
MSRERKTPENSSARPAAKPAAPTPGTRKAYAAPKVRAYGNIRDITLGVGNTGNRDGAPGSHKTNT